MYYTKHIGIRLCVRRYLLFIEIIAKIRTSMYVQSVTSKYVSTYRRTYVRTYVPHNIGAEYMCLVVCVCVRGDGAQ